MLCCWLRSRALFITVTTLDKRLGACSHGTLCVMAFYVSCNVTLNVAFIHSCATLNIGGMRRGHSTWHAQPFYCWPSFPLPAKLSAHLPSFQTLHASRRAKSFATFASIDVYPRPIACWKGLSQAKTLWQFSAP